MRPSEERLSWVQRASVGVPTLDRDHAILLDLIHQFHDAWAQGLGVAEINAVLDVLQDYCVRHFAVEEALMKRIGFPGLDDHRREHILFTDQVMGFRYRAQFDHPEALYVALYAFLMNWWREHILEHDQAYAEYLSDRTTVCSVA